MKCSTGRSSWLFIEIIINHCSLVNQNSFWYLDQWSKNQFVGDRSLLIRQVAPYVGHITLPVQKLNTWNRSVKPRIESCGSQTTENRWTELHFRSQRALGDSSDGHVPNRNSHVFNRELISDRAFRYAAYHMYIICTLMFSHSVYYILNIYSI